MVSDPPEQTAAEIVEVIGASRASLSIDVRLLEAIGRGRPVTGRRTW